MRPDIPPYTSASQLVSYTMCPRKYAFQYVHGIEPEFRSLSLVLGSAVHSAVGWWFTERLAGKTPAVCDAEEIVAADILATTVDAPIRWKEATPASLEAEARALVRTYLLAKGEIEVTAVEQAFQVDLVDSASGEVLGRPMKGYFDLVLPDDRVVELKTSARGWASEDLSRHLQVGAYAFALQQMRSRPSELEVHVVVKLKREPRVETYEVERGDSGTRWWLRAASEIEGAIASGHFPPKPSPLCRECEFETTCAGWVLATEAPATRRRLPTVADRFADAAL